MRGIIIQNMYFGNKVLNYHDSFGKQLVMFLQLMSWIEEGRLNTDKEKTYILDAKYEIGEFIPNLEIIKET